MKRVILGGVGLVAILIILSNHTDEQEPDKTKVVASFYPYYEFARNVAGDSATTEQYLPSGVRVHDWEPQVQEIRSLLTADLFVYNGLGVDPYVDGLISSGEFDDLLFVKASGMNHTDPHIWLDPVLAKAQVDNIRDGLIQVDPNNTIQYIQNAQLYNMKLDTLHTAFESALDSCKKNTIVPIHNAFTHLAKRYGIKVMALDGLAPSSVASASEIADTINFIKKNDIKTIIAEDSVNSRFAQVIADETGAEVMILNPAEVVGSYTYISIMEQNLDVLKVALEC